MLSLGLRGRELGAPPRGRLEPANALAMYADSLEPRSERETRSSVFNLRFSPRGSELVAVQRDKSIAVFDALRMGAAAPVVRFIGHTDSVNVCEFVGEYGLLTGSDDTTVGVWDVRRLNERPVRRFGSHGGWVKNIEVVDEHRVISSCLEGCVWLWDLARPESSATELLLCPGLLRTRYHAPTRRVFISSYSAGLFAVHDAGLDADDTDALPLAVDLARAELAWRFFFECRAVSRSSSSLRDVCALQLPSVFLRRAWRLESLAERRARMMMSSLQVSPDGSLLLARGGRGVNTTLVFAAQRQNRLVDALRASCDERKLGEVDVVDMADEALRAAEEAAAEAADAPRLIGMVCEPPEEIGIIRELAFSPCGRFFASPFRHGVRVFASPTVEDAGEACASAEPAAAGVPQLQPLNADAGLVGTGAARSGDEVLCCSFHPRLPLLATGSDSGHVALYWPEARDSGKRKVG